MTQSHRPPHAPEHQHLRLLTTASTPPSTPSRTHLRKCPPKGLVSACECVRACVLASLQTVRGCKSDSITARTTNAHPPLSQFTQCSLALAAALSNTAANTKQPIDCCRFNTHARTHAREHRKLIGILCVCMCFYTHLPQRQNKRQNGCV